ncbi:MAG: pyridine nucleotide-disulfide oxidoreductase [Gammaproteobacteria bacterium]|nr:MAG: pyridine nucleotide-disulfide oxidoreductase [Gammaproteobacteria bacterium]
MRLLSSKPRICIIGGGFAGLNAAKQFKASDYEVTLIDPKPYVEWLPNIHEIISGVKSGNELRLDRRRVVARLGHRFEQAKVVDINAAAVTLENGNQVPFDACIVSTGGVINHFGVAGAAEHALGMKSVADCQRIAKKLKMASLGQKTIRVAVVGGGIEGVEALGEALRTYRNKPQFEFYLVDNHRKMLSGCAGNLDAQIKKRVRPFNVGFELGHAVSQVHKEGVLLDNGKLLNSDVTIWSAGLAPNPLLHSAKLSDSPRHWCEVNDAFQSHHYENVFVIGDAAQTPQPLLKQAFHAIDMGRFAGQNVARFLSGQRLRRFRPSPKPQVVTFGDLDTFMVFDGFSVSSSVLGAAKEAVYNLGLLQLSPPDNPQDFVRSVGWLQKSIRKVYLPAANPLSLVSRLPEMRLLR